MAIINKYNQKSLLAYYFFMLVVLLTWTNPNALPPMPLRVLYLLMSIFPILNKSKIYFPIAFCTLLTISMVRYAPSYMVSTPLFVFIVLLFVTFFYKGKNEVKPPYHLLFLCIYIALVNLLTGFEFKDACLTFASVFLLSRYLGNSGEVKKLFITSFIVISAVLSAEYLLVGKNFTDAYSTSEIERMGWTDPNVFGCIIGIGIICGVISLLYKIYTSRSAKYIVVGAIVVAFMAFLLNASRGASLALFVVLIMLLISAPVAKSTKSLMFLLAIAFMFVMYSLGYFDNLIFRMTIENAETGGERTIIWQTKTHAFFSEYGLFNHIFGLGDKDACFLGYGYYLGFHSDYFAMLVKYGYVGLAMLLYMICYPIKVASKNKVLVVLLVVYFSLCIFSLDLVNSGHITFFYLYLFLLVLGQGDDLNSINNKQVCRYEG